MANAPVFDLPIGAEGKFPGDVKFKIIGAVVRSVQIDGIHYYWHEYLLYNPMVGFRWLVHSDNHWNFVESVNAADIGPVMNYATGSNIDYNGQKFKIFQDAIATVEYVKGEFYWRVEQGEQVRAIDFVAAPMMLSQEIGPGEINWSVGTYMPIEEVEKVFGVSGLPRPWGIAPNQPFTGKFYYTWGALPVLALIVLAIFMVPISGLTKSVLDQQIMLPPMTSSTSPQAAFSQPFQLKGNSNVRITAGAQVDNSWADLDVDLVKDGTEEIESVNIPVEYYSGVDDGESWSEGGKSSDATLSSLPAGTYTLKVEGTWQNWQAQMPVTVKVEQNVNRGVNFCFSFVLLLIVPILGLFRKITFESRRWKDSMFGSSASGGSDDSGDSDD
jgi:hypothetical protein